MTQVDPALKVGVIRVTIDFLEKGKYNPSLKLAHDVAVALGATIDGLFLWDEIHHPVFQRCWEKKRKKISSGESLDYNATGVDDLNGKRSLSR